MIHGYFYSAESNFGSVYSSICLDIITKKVRIEYNVSTINPAYCGDA